MNDELSRLISKSENWLMRRILDYAKRFRYSQYTSTLEEAWRISIQGLSQELLAALERSNDPPELDPDLDFAADPMAAFGILEAQRHRSRGITLAMFLGLMKYYRQTYLDLIKEKRFPAAAKRKYLLYIERFFDRVEIGFCSEWCSHDAAGTQAELQASNRAMTNEKNKYLTVFESLAQPVFLLDTRHLIDNLNQAAASLIAVQLPGGSTYYGGAWRGKTLPWLNKELEDFASGTVDELSLERELPLGESSRYFSVGFKKMLDVSGKFSGITVIFKDLSERQRMAAALAWESEVRRALTELSALLISERNIGDITEHVLNAGLRLIASPLGFVGFIDPLSGHLVAPTMTRQIWDQCQVPDKSFVFSHFKGLWGWVLKHKKALLSNRPQDDPRSGGIPPGHLAIDRFLAVPVLDGEKLVGGIFLANKEDEYSNEDLALLQRIGALYAIALQRKEFENERETLILEYQAALAQVKQLSGLLPICASCKKVRDDQGYWTQIEEYIVDHSEADFSHGLCPECLKKLYPDIKK